MRAISSHLITCILRKLHAIMMIMRSHYKSLHSISYHFALVCLVSENLATLQNDELEWWVSFLMKCRDCNNERSLCTQNTHKRDALSSRVSVKRRSQPKNCLSDLMRKNINQNFIIFKVRKISQLNANSEHSPAKGVIKLSQNWYWEAVEGEVKPFWVTQLTSQSGCVSWKRETQLATNCKTHSLL